MSAMLKMPSAFFKLSSLNSMEIAFEVFSKETKTSVAISWMKDEVLVV